jgi:transposase
VHEQTVAACARVPGSKEHASSTYGPLGRGRRRSCACAIGSEPHGVTHVALESTGVYWKPIHYVLEESFACLLVKPAHVKEVPGRKDRRRRLGGAGSR